MAASAISQRERNGERAALRSELRDALLELSAGLAEDFDDDTPLISSGMLDSAALFSLLLWIEERSGRRIDPSEVDIGARWDTVQGILDFLGHGHDDENAAAQVDSARTASRPPVGIEFRRLQPTDREAVARFQLRSWSRDLERNRACFDWKYFHAPAAEHTRIYGALRDGELIAMRSLYGSFWEFGPGSVRVPALVADDLLVREDFRGSGLVTDLMTHAFAELSAGEVSHALNVSGGRVTVLNSLAMGWRRAGLFRPVGRETPAARRWRALRRAIAGAPYLWRHAAAAPLYAPAERHPFRCLDRAGRRLRAPDGTPVEIMREAPASAMAELVARLGHDGRIRQVRDEAFLSWRYAHPLHDYRFLTVGGRQLDGYLVLKWSVASFSPDPRVKIVDLEAADDKLRRALLEAAVEHGGFLSLYAWSAAHSDSDLARFAALGFEPADQHLAAHGCPCWLVRPLTAGGSGQDWRWRGLDLLEPRSWDLRMVYGMQG